MLRWKMLLPILTAIVAMGLCTCSSTFFGADALPPAVPVTPTPTVSALQPPGTPAPTGTPSATPSGTPTPSPTPTATQTPVPTATRTPTPTIAGTPDFIADAPLLSVSVLLDVGQYASVNLIQRGDQTEVQLSVKPVSNDAPPPEPAAIVHGSCAGPREPVYTLNAVTNYRSTTLVNASLAALLSGDLSITVGKSLSQANVIVSCGVIPKGSILTLGPGRDGDQRPGTVALQSAGTATYYIVAMQPIGYSIEQPAIVYQGSCANLGSAAYMLRSVRSGSTAGTINAPLAELLKGGYALSIQKSTTEPGLSVACVDLK